MPPTTPPGPRPIALKPLVYREPGSPLITRTASSTGMNPVRSECRQVHAASDVGARTHNTRKRAGDRKGLHRRVAGVHGETSTVSDWSACSRGRRASPRVTLFVHHHHQRRRVPCPRPTDLLTRTPDPRRSTKRAIRPAGPRYGLRLVSARAEYKRAPQVDQHFTSTTVVGATAAATSRPKTDLQTPSIRCTASRIGK